MHGYGWICDECNGHSIKCISENEGDNMETLKIRYSLPLPQQHGNKNKNLCFYL